MFFNNLCKPQDGALATRWWSQTSQRAASQPTDLNVVKLASAETTPAPVDLTRLPDAGGGISIIV